MKTLSILLSAILMATITPAFAQTTSGTQDMKTHQSMKNMLMHQDGSDMKMMSNCMSMRKGMHMDKGMKGMKGMQMDKNMPCANQTAHATGVIKAIDTTKGTVTIKHQAIASIHWSAMTMTFKADPASLLKDIKVGEKVNFTLHPNGMNSTVTAISAVK